MPKSIKISERLIKLEDLLEVATNDMLEVQRGSLKHIKRSKNQLQIPIKMYKNETERNIRIIKTNICRTITY